MIQETRLEQSIFSDDFISTPAKIYIPENVSNDEPIQLDCECHSCLNYTKAYLHHLFKHNEMLAYVLVTIHNCYNYERFFRLVNFPVVQNNFALAALILRAMCE